MIAEDSGYHCIYIMVNVKRALVHGNGSESGHQGHTVLLTASGQPKDLFSYTLT